MMQLIYFYLIIEVHCTTGRSPAWLMFKRELRTRFDLLEPDVLATVEQKQYDQKVSVDGKRKIDLNPGDNIFATDFRVRLQIH